MLGILALSWWRRNNPYLNSLRNRLIPVDPLFASVPVEEANSSYTDKNVIYVCIRDENGQYYDPNTITGVLLHELAHVKTPFYDPDHKSDTFKNNELDLMRKAQRLGLWSPDIPVPCDYCGVDMTNVSCRRRQ